MQHIRGLVRDNVPPLDTLALIVGAQASRKLRSLATEAGFEDVVGSAL